MNLHKHLIEQTDDGSATLFLPQLNEHYHSTKGARTESQHVFINMGLRALERQQVRILEVGLGTGLNAWLTLCAAKQARFSVHYTALELYPLDWDEVAPLGYADESDSLFRQLHTCAWETSVALTSYFTLRKQQTDFHRFVEQPANTDLLFDLIYYDAFAPEKQPNMWSEELFRQLFVLVSDGGILTTYCAKGVVRRMLQAAGFTVERLAGPPGGKREILRARKYPPCDTAPQEQNL